MKLSHWIVMLEVFPLMAAAAENSETRRGLSRAIQLVTYPTHSRLTLRADQSFPSDFKHSSRGFEWIIKGLTLSDLGAPLSQELKWAAQFSDLRDMRLSSLTLKEIPQGVKVSGKWVFPKGKLSLAHPQMETFHYHENLPAQYVVDFWIKDKTTVVEMKQRQEQKQRSAELKKAEEGRKKRIERKIASVNLQQEAEKLDQYCNVALNESNDVFIEFYPVHPQIDFSQWLPKGTADTRFIYDRPEEKTREAAHVRIALDLRAQGKPALAIRALDFLASEVPETHYGPQVKFLRANSFEILGLHRESESLFNELVSHNENSKIAFQSATFLANRYMEEGQASGALSKFLWLIQNFPDHPLIWVFHLGAAESFYALQQTVQAVKEYRWIVDHGPNRVVKSDALLRSGDLFLLKKQNEQALLIYGQALKYFENELQDSPPFFLNRGEAFFRIGNFEDAKKSYEAFLSRFPIEPNGWRAALRVGEVYNRSANEKESASEARRWFYETINRYPTSPGGTLARLRLLPCGDHGGFSKNSAEVFFSKEAADYDGNGEVVLTHYKDLRGLSRVRTLMSLGTKKETLLRGVQELKTAHSPILKKILSRATETSFQKSITDLLTEGKKFEALHAYLELAPLLPNPENPSQADYLIKLSLAASDLGLGSLSEKLANSVLKASTSTASQGDRGVASTKDSQKIDLVSRLNPDSLFSKAKALWVLNPDAQDPASFDKIRQLLEAIPNESPLLLEKELILGLLEEKRGKLPSALSHAMRVETLSKRIRIQSWVASLMYRAGDPNLALHLYREIEKRVAFQGDQSTQKDSDWEEGLGVPPVPPLQELMNKQAEILEKQNRWAEAATVYSRMIEKSGGQPQLTYQYARALKHSGEPSAAKKAEALFKDLAQGDAKKEGDLLWKKLAQVTIANEIQERILTKNAMEGVE